MISMRMIQATMVWFVFKANRRDKIGHINAPAIPALVAVIDSRAMATVSIFNSVRANKMAVPEMVAMASERRNHAIRNITAWRSWKATFIVFQSEIQAKEMYE
jgi:predicted ATP-grasp superfamily ATP-dependent carboligase